MKPKMSRLQYDAIVAAALEIQKRNPPGSEMHRKAHEAMRRAARERKGVDIGEYKP